MLFEQVPVVLQQRISEVVGWFIEPQPGIVFVTAEGEPPDFLLEVGQTIGVAQRRHVGRQISDSFRNDVLVPHWLQWHRNAGKSANLSGPLPGAIDDLLAADIASGRSRSDHAPVDDVETRHGDTLKYPGPVHAGATRQRLRQIRRACLTIGWHECRTNQIAGLQDRPARFDLVWAQQVHVETETACRRCLSFELNQPIG